MDGTQIFRRGVRVHQVFDQSIRLFNSSWKIILLPFMVVFFIFFGIYSLGHVFHFATEVLSKDPMATAELPFYYGIFSNLGVMVWASSAAINFFGAVVLRDDTRKARFMLVSGILIVWLVLDDLLMFHEEVFPEYLHIPENIIYCGYLFIIAAYLLYFLKDIFTSTNYILLLAALAAFASSMLIDLVWEAAFVEDGAKFLGIIFWVSYYFNSVKTFVSNQMISCNGRV